MRLGIVSFAIMLVVGMLGVGTQPLHAQGTWTTKAAMPTPRGGTTAGVVAGKLYVVSGFSTSPDSTANEVYNPAVDAWTSAAPIPTPRSYAAAGSIGGKLYVVGGCTFREDCRIGTINVAEAYDPTTNSWASVAPMPTARSGVGTGVIGDKLYVAGGTGACPPCIPLATLEEYDPGTNTWTTKAPMPTARSGLAVGVVNGVLYAVGGLIGGGGISSITYLNTVEAYDPVTNTWATKKVMPTPRSALGAAVVNDILYAVSGTNGSDLNTVEAYDPIADSWTTAAPIPTARYLPQPQVIDDVIYVAGNGAGNTAIATLEAFTPSQCTSLPCIESPSDGATPQSHFVALSGRGSPGDTLTVLINGLPFPGSVTVDAEGRWEALPNVSPYGPSVTVQVSDQATGGASNIITVHPQTAGLLPGPGIPSLSRLLTLRHADIFLDADPNSLQVIFYGPNWTHTALYLGGEEVNGTPMVAEAVTADEAGGGQQVRRVSLEQSLLWTAPRISGFTPRSAISNATRDAIVAWAGTVTNQVPPIPYWKTPLELPGLVVAAAVAWKDRSSVFDPRFLAVLIILNADKNSTSKFICSTLVWAAYWHGTGQTVDISDPNLMTAEPGSALDLILDLRKVRDKPLFVEQLRPVFVVPETFARSPKLKQIF